MSRRTRTPLPAAALTAAVVAASAPALAADPTGAADSATAIFAGGCFWCMESAFEPVDGVSRVISGYLGGGVADPTYEQVSAGGTGHYEAVKVTYDPSRVGYARLLDVFWRNIDPVDGGGQFCDRGDQYRSAIFYENEEQKGLAEQSKEDLANSGRLGKPIVTPILAATVFYPAEEYHQDYYKKNPLRYRYYRASCGRDRRLTQLWGEASSPAH
jgi:methionine-S-sulfoxide reductase